MKWHPGHRENVHRKRIVAARKCKRWTAKLEKERKIWGGPGKRRCVAKFMRKRKQWCWTGKEGDDPTRPIHIR